MPRKEKKNKKNIPIELVIEMAKNGHTTIEIASAVGCTQSAVSKILARRKIKPARKRGERGSGKRVRKDHAELVRAMANTINNVMAEQEKVKVCEMTIRRCLPAVLELINYQRFYNGGTRGWSLYDNAYNVTIEAVTEHVYKLLNKTYVRVANSITKAKRYRRAIREAIQESIITNNRYDFYDEIAARGIDPAVLYHPSSVCVAKRAEKTTPSEAAGRARMENRAMRSSWAAVPGPAILVATAIPIEYAPIAVHRAIQTAGVVNITTPLKKVLGWDDDESIKRIIETITNRRVAEYVLHLLFSRKPVSTWKLTRWVSIKEMMRAAMECGLLYSSSLPRAGQEDEGYSFQDYSIFDIPVPTSIFYPLRDVLELERTLEETAAAWAPEPDPVPLSDLPKNIKKRIAARWLAGNHRAEKEAAWGWGYRNHRNFGQNERINRATAYQAKNGF